MAVIDGYKGTLQYGPAGSETTIDFVGAWSADVKRATKETGPYITSTSDGSTGVSLGALTVTGTLDGDMFSGANAARAGLTAAVMAGTRIRLVLAETGGQTLTIPTAVLSGLKKSVKGSDTSSISYDFQNDGAFTLA